MAVMVDKGKVIKGLTIELFALLITLGEVGAVGDNKVKVLRLHTVLLQDFDKQGEISGIAAKPGLVSDDYNRM